MKNLIILASLPIVAFGFGNFFSFCRKQHSKYFNREYCDEEWISFNRTGLAHDLEKKVFGQHIALRIIPQALRGFMTDCNPQKPLVLSLHGWTGTGKNLVSALVAKNIYKNGMNSKYVHLFVSTVHFPNPSLIETYKSQLQQWIRGNVTQCQRSMFIFDGLDNMPPGLIDSIKPYLDNYDMLDGASYRKAIFIFLSNAGGACIVEKTLDFWKNGQDRSEIRFKDLEKALSQSVYNDKNSGLRHSLLIDNNLVDFFVPFLPLEFRHVLQCVMAEMEARGLKPSQDVAGQLARDLNYFPEEERVFSVSGCRKINTNLKYYAYY